MRTPTTLRIKFSKSETIAQFIERYAADVSRSGIFIRTREPLPVGTLVHFDFQLRDSSPLLEGDGTVLWTRPHDAARTGTAAGMGIRFDRLTAGSQGVIEQILADKVNRGGTAESRFDAGVRDAQGVAGTVDRDSHTPLPQPRPGLPPEDFGPDESTRVMQSDQSRRLIAESRGQDEEWGQMATVADLAMTEALAAASVRPSGPLVTTPQEDRTIVDLADLVAPRAVSRTPEESASVPSEIVDPSASPEVRQAPRQPPPPPRPTPVAAVEASSRTPEPSPGSLAASLAQAEVPPAEPAPAPASSSVIAAPPAAAAATPIDPRPAIPAQPRRSGRTAILLSLILIAAIVVGLLILRREDRAATGGGVAPAQGPEPTAVQPAAVDVDVRTTPPGATVIVDGKPAAGPTPTRLVGLDPKRTYEIVLKRPGYRSITRSLQPVPGRAWNAALEAAERAVEVSSTPPGAQVLLDGAPVGTTGPTPLRLKLLRLAEGQELLLRHPGFADEARRLTEASTFVARGDGSEVIEVVATLQRVGARPAPAVRKPEPAKAPTQEPAESGAAPTIKVPAWMQANPNAAPAPPPEP